MARKLVELIKNTPFYYPLKRSNWANFLFDRNKFNQTKAELTFLKSILPTNTSHSIIFDVGANIGFKTNIFSILCKQVIAFEPDQSNLTFLRGLFASKRNVSIEPVGISSTKGKHTFFIHEKGSGFNTLNPKWKEKLESADNRWKTSYAFEGSTTIETITLDDAIAQYGKPAYIKIDVEGHELEVVKGLSQAVPLLSIEANLPEFLNETIEIIKHLQNINRATTYNITNSDKFMFDKFMSATETINFLNGTTLKYLEVYAKTGY